jgi:hypothetical protein
MPKIISGQLSKMTHKESSPIQYFLNLDDDFYPLTSKVGQKVTIKHTGKITCVECGRVIKKTYSDGHCFPCTRDLPENDICSVRPEKCQHDKGNDADREFYEKYCNIDHYVYLSQTSGVKVGITRHFNIPSRWIDQGAMKALVIAKVPRRILSGQIEIILAKQISDKTNWRKMLSGQIDVVDFPFMRRKMIEHIPKDLKQYAMYEEKIHSFIYPVDSVPKKISSHNLDKENEFSEKLTGIKGQYLIFENRVINMRKYSGYHIEFAFED